MALTSALEGLFLGRLGVEVEQDAETSEQVKARTESLIQRSLIFILNYLGEHPNDGYTRASLYRLLSPEIAGVKGIVHLTLPILDSPPPKVASIQKSPSVDPLPREEFATFFEAVVSKLPQSMILGLGSLPTTAFSVSVDRVLRSITISLYETSKQRIADQSDIQTLFVLLHVGILACREVGKEEEDGPKLFELAAAGLAASGHFQSARDLAELCLQFSSQSSRQHKRGAWLAYADIYLRCHNPLEALIGLGCALQCSVDVLSPDNRYHEIVLACRIIRQLRLFRQAIALIPLAREQAVHTETPDQALARIDYLELSIRFQMMNSQNNETLSFEKLLAIHELTDKAVELNRRARIKGEDVLPTASILAQINGFLLALRQPVDHEAQRELDDSLPAIGADHAQLLKALASGKASVEAIETLSSNLSRTRYTEDLGTDVSVITSLARRALRSVAQSFDAPRALFLIEWLTDLSSNTTESDQFTRSNAIDIAESAARTGVERLIPQSIFSNQAELERLHELADQTDPSIQVQNRRYPISAETLAQFMQETSKAGVDLHSIALTGDFTGDQSLIKVSSEDGDISVMAESKSVFDSHAHHQWEQKYPYGYLNFASDDLFGLNRVEQTMAAIGITSNRPGKPILVIPDVRVQNIPPNLLLIDDTLAGIDRPMAIAPSLTWLKALRSVEYVPSRRYKAWIPASNIAGDILLRLAEDLAVMLSDYEITFSNDRVMPDDMGGSDIAVIGAHGGLQEENWWFGVVRDEATTRLSTRDVAAKLRGCGVVILFVCSGGRVDRHPFSSATVGLAQSLLDHGCRTVIASAWPIDVRVARYWLPSFLESFASGDENVITANYFANRKVAVQFNYHPMISLAMNVFGDPLHRATAHR